MRHDESRCSNEKEQLMREKVWVSEEGEDATGQLPVVSRVGFGSQVNGPSWKKVLPQPCMPVRALPSTCYPNLNHHTQLCSSFITNSSSALSCSWSRRPNLDCCALLLHWRGQAAYISADGRPEGFGVLVFRPPKSFEIPSLLKRLEAVQSASKSSRSNKKRETWSDRYTFPFTSLTRLSTCAEPAQ